MSENNVELRVDGRTLISHIGVYEDLKSVYIPASSHPWGVAMTFAYKDLAFLVDKLLVLYGGSHHMVKDYVALVCPDKTNLYLRRAPSYSQV